MKFLDYFTNLFKRKENGNFFSHPNYNNYSHSKKSNERNSLNKEFDENESDNFENSLNYNDLIEGISNKVNRDRVIDAIEAHKGTYSVFTTTMVYKWLLGNMPILSVRKCIYKLQAQGYLEHCKKTIGTNKRVKYYSVKND